LILDLGDRRLASIEAGNCVQATRAPQLELFGLNGTIAINLLDVAAPIEIFRKDGGWEQIQVPHERRNGPDHVLGIEHLIDCVDGRTAPVLSIEHAIHVVEIIEKAALAARDERVFTVDSRFALGNPPA
jgi:predicted dehydrogenase